MSNITLKLHYHRLPSAISCFTELLQSLVLRLLLLSLLLLSSSSL